VTKKLYVEEIRQSHGPHSSRFIMRLSVSLHIDCRCTHTTYKLMTSAVSASQSLLQLQTGAK